jgi:opacity protein-like surface antigen
MTFRRGFIAATLLLTIAAADAAAQQRWEVQPFFGGRFGGGFDVDAPVATPHGFRVAEIDFESGPTYGFTVGYFVSQMVQLEFLMSRQQTGIEAAGVKISDASHTQYHGNVLFHFGDDDSRVRPYVLVGFGASNINPDLPAADNVTKFSFGIGGGVKTYFSDHVGMRFQVRLAPTYVTEEPALFCDPFGFCWGVHTPVYSYQTEATVGVNFRF